MNRGHIPCPKCRDAGKDRSGNNMFQYEDGHTYCFACGFSQRPTIERQLRLVHPPNQDKLALPEDTSKTIPSIALLWLAKYGITQQELIDFNVMWSDKTNWLIFPIFDNDVLLSYQARNFSRFGNKYYTRGSVGSIVNYYDQKNLKQPKDTIILVEDMVSAIKLSRQFTVMPLFGSHLSTERTVKLVRFFKKFVFWLDYDKAHSAINQATRLKQYVVETSVIITGEDPKSYDDVKICDIVNSIVGDRVSDLILDQSAACC